MIGALALDGFRGFMTIVKRQVVPNLNTGDIVVVDPRVPGAAGEAGVAKALTILTEELEHTMRQLGCAKLEDLNESHVVGQFRPSFSAAC